MSAVRDLYERIIDTLDAMGYRVTETERRSVVEYLKEDADPEALLFDPDGVVEAYLERIEG